MLNVWVEAGLWILLPGDPLISPPTLPISVSVLPIDIRVEQYWPKQQKLRSSSFCPSISPSTIFTPFFFPAYLNFSKFN